MKSKLDRWRQALLCGAVLASGVLAACGGGEQVQTFAPSRVIAFGDETSVIDDFNGDANGRKYTINATVSATDPTLACRVNPIWVQVVADFYGLVFPQCNPAPGAVAAPASRIRAMPNARVADLAAQIDAQVAESAFGPKDLTTVLAGQNDILLDIYPDYPQQSEIELTDRAEAAGAALGVQVNRIADADAKVLLSTVPDLGLTPFAAAEKAAHTDIDRAGLLTRLSARFNAKMRETILNDGRRIGLILTDEYLQAVVRIAGGGGFTDVVTPVCDLTKSTQVPPSALDCTTLTLITGGNGTAYLWADRTHLSSGGQAQFGAIALTRATNNPF